MKELIKNLVSIERKISAEKGGFFLFGLFLLEDFPDRWDLVAAAPWFKARDDQALNYIAKILQERLAPKEIVKLSRVALIAPDNPGIEKIHQLVDVEHGTVEMASNFFFSMDMKRAYIITSRRESSPASVRSG